MEMNKYNIVLKNKDVEMVTEDDVPFEYVLDLINSVFKYKEEDTTLYINIDNKTLPGKKYRYEHNYKIAYILSLILESSKLETGVRELQRFSGLNNYEIAYGKGFFEFDKSDIKRLIEDLITAGRNPFRVTHIEVYTIFRYLKFCREKARELGVDLNITDVSYEDNELSEQPKSESKLSYDEMISVAKDESYDYEMRLMLLMIYKGVVQSQGENQEISKIKFKDVVFNKDRTYIKITGKKSREIDFWGEEVKILKNLIDRKKQNVGYLLKHKYEMYDMDVMDSYIFIPRKRKPNNMELTPLFGYSTRRLYLIELDKIDDSSLKDKLNLSNVRNSGYSHLVNHYRNAGDSEYLSIVKALRTFAFITEKKYMDYIEDPKNMRQQNYKRYKYNYLAYS